MTNYFSTGVCLIVFLTLVAGPVQAESSLDTDSDGLTDEQEIAFYHTDPNNADTDGDGFSDGEEIWHGYSPHAPKKQKLSAVDSDKDGLNDALEIAFATDLTVRDTDDDGVNDYDEIMTARDPLSAVFGATLARRLEADLTNQRLYYIVDSETVLNLPMSSGNPGTPTPPGEYEIMNKIPIKRYRGADFDLPNVKWNMEFRRGGYFIHTAYWHNDFGKKTHSHGCLNLREKDAALLYKYIDKNTAVKVVGVTPKKRKVGT